MITFLFLPIFQFFLFTVVTILLIFLILAFWLIIGLGGDGEIVQSAEKNIGVDFTDDYEVVREDWDALGFDLTEYLDIKFEEQESFDNFVKNIELKYDTNPISYSQNISCEDRLEFLLKIREKDALGYWVKTEESYTFVTYNNYDFSECYNGSMSDLVLRNYVYKGELYHLYEVEAKIDLGEKSLSYKLIGF